MRFYNGDVLAFSSHLLPIKSNVFLLLSRYKNWSENIKSTLNLIYECIYILTSCQIYSLRTPSNLLIEINIRKSTRKSYLKTSSKFPLEILSNNRFKKSTWKNKNFRLIKTLVMYNQFSTLLRCGCHSAKWLFIMSIMC